MKIATALQANEEVNYEGSTHSGGVASPQVFHHKEMRIKMKNIFLAVLILAGGVALVAALPASAQRATYFFGAGISAGQGASPKRAKTLIQDRLSEVNVSVTRYFGTSFVDIGGPHMAFVPKAATHVGNLVMSDLADSYIVGASSSRNISGRWFSNEINCEVCGTGESNPNLGLLTFSISSLDGLPSIYDSVANSSGHHYFVNTLSNSSTGQVAAVGAISEPPNYALMLAGLGLMSFVASRRRQQGI